MGELMTLEDIGRMFRRPPEKAQALVLLPGFPEEAPSSTPRHRLWIRAEVRAFKPLAAAALTTAQKNANELFFAKCAAIEAGTKANRRHHNGKRRTAQLQRTPPWADLKAIELVYKEAVRVEQATGIAQHVDHIYPLQGRLVSGLHVAENLQVLPKLENIRKNNRYEVPA